jgi:transposase InsO family protein
MKEWWTAREIAEAALPEAPTTARGVDILAKRESWNANPQFARKREGRGGGMEYHYSLFPEAARAELARRAAAEAARAARLPAVASVAQLPAIPETPAARAPLLTGAGLDRQDAKLVILAAFDAFLGASAGRMSKDAAVHLFVGTWSAAQIEAPGWVREAHPRISPRSLWNWLKARTEGDPARLAGRYGGRAGSGRWDNEFAMIRDQAVQLMCAQPHWSAVDIRNAMAARFCDRDADGEMVAVSGPDGGRQLLPLPSVSEFQRMLRAWKQTHITLFRSFHDPDGYNSKDRLRLGSHIQGIVCLNQLWMIDASPQDLLLIEGRHSLYLVIDVWSRRVLILITATPRTEAMKLLLRRALLAWGVPEGLKTDNGSDFTSREALRVFAALRIEHLPATPYAPWEKSFVERAIGTLQHDLYPKLPGYTGHNVAAAQRLRAARPFSERLGESDREAFAVQLNSAQAQQAADVWAAEVYGGRGHGGAGMDGLSPLAKAASWGGVVRHVPDERALDLLLARAEGTRLVRGKGIQVNNRHYYARDLLPLLNTGEAVEVRIDPATPHLAFVWRREPLEFLAVAECLEMMKPTERAEFAAREQAHQKQVLREERAEVRAAGGETDRLTVATEIFGHQVRQTRKGRIIALPVTEQAHSSPELAAAGQAVRALAAPVTAPEPDGAEAALRAQLEAEHAAALVAPRPVPETDEGRFRRALELQQRLDAGEPVAELEQAWLRGYRKTGEYLGYRDLYESFGEQMLAVG